jgi:hypothetical protein
MSMYSFGAGPKDMPARKLASVEGIARIWSKLGTPGKGATIGLGAMLPFLPGMLGSRKKGGDLKDIYSGVDPVPIRGGRWCEVGSTAFEGARIKEWRPHWSILHKSHAEDIALYGSEAEKWKHNPILHPIRWWRDSHYPKNRAQTRCFRPFRRFATIKKDCVQHGICCTMCLYINRLQALFPGQSRSQYPAPAGPPPETAPTGPGNRANRAHWSHLPPFLFLVLFRSRFSRLPAPPTRNAPDGLRALIHDP